MQDMQVDTVDISGMDFGQLDALRGRIDERVREMRETGGPALRERWGQEAAAIGMTVDEVMQLGGKRRGRPPKANAEE